MQNRRGFTLVETLVVMVIIVVLSSFLIPTLPDVTSRRLKSTARRISGVISHIYDRSAATQLTYRLTFDLKANSYYVSLLNKQNSFEETELPFAKRSELANGVDITEITTAYQGRVTEGKAYIHFFPGGFAERSVIHITDDAKNSMSLIVKPLTGRVIIRKGYVDVADKAA